MVNNPPAMQEMQETQLQSLHQEDPLEKEGEPHSSFLAWRIPWQRSLVGYSPGGCMRVGHDLATEQQQTARQHFTAQKSYHVDTQRTFLLFVVTAFHCSITLDFLLL